MTDLDQLLAGDARRDRLNPPELKNLEDAVRYARAATRRRRQILTSGLALAAVGVVGGSFLHAGATTTPQHTSHPRLAAYDRILGPDGTRPNYVLVIGPADKHTAHCSRVPGTHVYHRDGGRLIRVSGLGHPAHDTSPATGAIDVYLPADFPDGPPGPYFEFQCPKP